MVTGEVGGHPVTSVLLVRTSVLSVLVVVFCGKDISTKVGWLMVVRGRGSISEYNAA